MLAREYDRPRPLDPPSPFIETGSRRVVATTIPPRRVARWMSRWDGPARDRPGRGGVSRLRRGHQATTRCATPSSRPRARVCVVRGLVRRPHASPRFRSRDSSWSSSRATCSGISFRPLADALTPGGVLLYETFTEAATGARPRTNIARSPVEARRAGAARVRGLETLFYEEIDRARCARAPGGAQTTPALRSACAEARRAPDRRRRAHRRRGSRIRRRRRDSASSRSPR